MKLLITGRHLSVSDSGRQQIKAKLRRLDRLLDGSAVSAQCILWQERETVVCELTLHARGDHMLHALGRNARLNAAVTAAADKLTQQAQRLKDRWKTRRRARGPIRRSRPEA
jgi:ribosomal subunit interface protein